MNGFVPNPMDWMRVVVEMQQAQFDAAGKMIEAGNAALDPERLDEARQQLEAASQRALDAAENWAKAQWQWLNLWQC